MSDQIQDLSNILEACLKNILAGKATVDECLLHFPDEAPTLAPMLKLALEARDQLAPNWPKPNYVASSRVRISSSISRRLQQAKRPRARQRPRRVVRWRPAQAFISLMLAIGVMAVSAGFVQAANGALPGDALYGLKRGIERARLVVTWNASGDIRLLAQNADMRLAELEALMAENRNEDLGLALDGFEETLTGLTDLAGEADPGSLEHVLDRLAHHLEVLARVSEQVPEAAQAAIARAIERSSHSQEVIQLVMQGGSPSVLAPGQLRTPPGQERTPPGQERTPPGQGGTPPGQQETPTDVPLVMDVPIATDVPPTATDVPPTATDVPPTATPAPTMHVSVLSITTQGVQARVTIHIATDIDPNVGEATVTGSWTVSGPTVEYSCQTLPSGKCDILSGNIKGLGPTLFTVTSVSGPYAYAPVDNAQNQIGIEIP